MEDKHTESNNARRQAFIYTLLNRADSMGDHAVRIRFEIERGTESTLAGALTDYYICSKPKDYLQRLDFLKESLNVLSDDWLLLFYDNLEEEFSSATILPYNQWSIFTEDVQGHFNFIDNPYAS